MIVVFDTNAYRDLVSQVPIEEVESLMNRLLQLEQAHNIQAMMCSITAEEILGHLLDDEQTRTYKSCIKATKAMYMHCGDEKQFRVVPSPQTQIASEYFGVHSHKFENTQIALGQLAFFISKDLTKANVNANILQLTKVKQHLLASEQELADAVLQMGKKIDPNYIDWNLFKGDESMRTKYLNYVRSELFRKEVAAGVLCAIAINLDAEGLITMPTSEQVDNMIKTYMKSYEASLNMQQYFYELVLQPDFDIATNSHANFLWDIQILHLVNHSINNEDILLVTSDKAMLRQANKAIEDKVMDFNEYRKYIGL